MFQVLLFKILFLGLTNVYFYFLHDKTGEGEKFSYDILSKIPVSFAFIKKKTLSLTLNI